jgi:hypothetical protein
MDVDAADDDSFNNSTIFWATTTSCGSAESAEMAMPGRSRFEKDCRHIEYAKRPAKKMK